MDCLNNKKASISAFETGKCVIAQKKARNF